MKRILIALLLIATAASAQIGSGFKGRGGGGSSTLDMSTLLPIIADSTLWHLQGTDTLVTDGALPIKVPGIRVTGNARLDGNLTLITTAAESLILGTGGFRNEGGLLQKGAATFGATGKTTVIQADGKVGILKTPTATLDVTGTIAASSTITSSSILSGSGLSLSGNPGGIQNSASGSDIAIQLRSTESPNSYYKAIYLLNPDLAGLAPYIGFGGIDTPASIIHINNNGVYSRPLFRISRDKRGGITAEDSTVMSITGSGKISFSTSIADTLNLFNIAGKKSSDSLFVVHNDIVGRDSVFAVLPTGGITAATIKVGASNFTTTQIDTVFTAGFVPRWVKFTSGAKSWYSPVYADTTGKW